MERVRANAPPAAQWWLPERIHAASRGIEARLSPGVCAPLLARIHKRAVNLASLGSSLEVLAHEAERLDGLTGDTTVECAAAQDVPRLIVMFGYKRGSTAYRAVAFGAATEHAAVMTNYGTACS